MIPTRKELIELGFSVTYDKDNDIISADLQLGNDYLEYSDDEWSFGIHDINISSIKDIETLIHIFYDNK